MKALVWWSGASVAVFDVAAGLFEGLRANGVTVQPFRLDLHLEPAAAALDCALKARRAEGREVESYTQGDVYYHANMRVLEQALRHDVEWVFMVSGLYQHPDYAAFLKRAGRKLAFVCTESPYQVSQELRMASLVDPANGAMVFDHVFVNERSMLPRYQSVHPSVSYLPAAWNPAVHSVTAAEAEPDVSWHDVVFVGTGFEERIALLSAMDWTGLDFGLYGTWSLLEDDAALRAYLPRDGDGVPVVDRFLPNTITAALYRHARVGVNLHRTSMEYEIDSPKIRHAESLNPRCYELAACGRFFVSDHRAEADAVFGGALPTFASAQEAERLIRRAIDEPAWRDDVAAMCLEQVQRHTWTARAAQALEALAESPVGVAA